MTYILYVYDFKNVLTLKMRGLKKKKLNEILISKKESNGVVESPVEHIG